MKCYSLDAAEYGFDSTRFTPDTFSRPLLQLVRVRCLYADTDTSLVHPRRCSHHRIAARSAHVFSDCRERLCSTIKCKRHGNDVRSWLVSLDWFFTPKFRS